jgi:hypothetical protein
MATRNMVGNHYCLYRHGLNCVYVATRRASERA